MSFPQIIAQARAIEGGLIARLPEMWMQGRTSYGGLSAALALEAARGLADDLPPLRSATVGFVGPLAGEVTVRAKMLRRGRNASWVTAEVAGEAGVGLVATFVFMGPVASELHINNALPPAGWGPPEDAKPLPPHIKPGFIDNFDRRFALPRQTEPLPEIAWWVRLRDRAGLDPMVELVLMADGLPPGVMPLLRKGPVSSMTWLINLLTAAPATRDGWFLVRAAGNYAENGCSSQEMGVWNADGAPLATGMQSIAIFG